MWKVERKQSRQQDMERKGSRKHRNEFFNSGKEVVKNKLESC